jgi:hypothetical protein
METGSCETAKRIMIMPLVFVLVSCSVILVSLPLVQGKVKPNGFYGIRIQKAFESESLWFQVNSVGGSILIYYSLVSIIVSSVLMVSAPGRFTFGTWFPIGVGMLYMIACFHIFLACRSLK